MKKKSKGEKPYSAIDDVASATDLAPKAKTLLEMSAEFLGLIEDCKLSYASKDEEKLLSSLFIANLSCKHLFEECAQKKLGLSLQNSARALNNGEYDAALFFCKEFIGVLSEK